VGVQRQVVGGERHVAVEQRLQPVAPPLVDPLGLLAPDQAVVAHHHLRSQRRGPVEQLEVRGDTRHQRRHLASAGDLEPVRPVILERRGVEQLVAPGDDLVAGGHARKI
jgi:hypothetical protein